MLLAWSDWGVPPIFWGYFFFEVLIPHVLFQRCDRDAYCPLTLVVQWYTAGLSF
jgi:hypothetical protein